MSPRIFLALGILVGMLGADFALAQSAPPASERRSLNETSRERRKALDDSQAAQQNKLRDWDQRAQETIDARSRKRAECRRQAKAQRLHLLKRLRFMRKCMAASPSVFR
jgi:hypothetical protein